MIMITHDLGIVAKVCDEVAVMYAGRIVEYGSLRDIFKRTKHPYTEGLFDSLPNIKERSARLNPIPGLVPDPTVVQPGCAFFAPPLPLRNGSLQDGGSGASLHGERPLCRLQRLRRPELQNPERRESRWLRNCSRSST